MLIPLRGYQQLVKSQVTGIGVQLGLEPGWPTSGTRTARLATGAAGRLAVAYRCARASPMDGLRKPTWRHLNGMATIRRPSGLNPAVGCCTDPLVVSPWSSTVFDSLHGGCAAIVMVGVSDSLPAQAPVGPGRVIVGCV